MPNSNQIPSPQSSPSLPPSSHHQREKNQRPSFGKDPHDSHVLEKFITTDDSHYDAWVVSDV